MGVLIAGQGRSRERGQVVMRSDILSVSSMFNILGTYSPLYGEPGRREVETTQRCGMRGKEYSKMVKRKKTRRNARRRNK